MISETDKCLTECAIKFNKVNKVIIQEGEFTPMFSKNNVQKKPKEKNDKKTNSTSKKKKSANETEKPTEHFQNNDKDTKIEEYSFEKIKPSADKTIVIGNVFDNKFLVRNCSKLLDNLQKLNYKVDKILKSGKRARTCTIFLILSNNIKINELIDNKKSWLWGSMSCRRFKLDRSREQNHNYGKRKSNIQDDNLKKHDWKSRNSNLADQNELIKLLVVAGKKLFENQFGWRGGVSHRRRPHQYHN